jgi:hypothetical protein
MSEPEEPREPREPRHACAGCDREIEDCSFCGERDCPAPTCYPDMLIALGLQVLHPHAHGGSSPSRRLPAPLSG